VDVFLSLPPTSPLRSPGDVECCLELLSNSAADIVITVREAERSPYFNMVRRADNGDVRLAIEGRYHRRQDAPALYDITTVAYVARADFVMQSSRIFDGRVRAVLVPRERALDIDTRFDMTIAEALVGRVDNLGVARVL
jgi:N-acylneuraminate cytidylyltransferase